MIILRKNRILLVSFLVFVSVFTFILANNKQTIETVSLPVSNKTVIIDAGHGVPDEGAMSTNGTTEASTNLKIALKVQNLLEQSGCTVILTRSDENAIYDIDSKTLKQKKVSDIQNRVKIGNTQSADIFVSIHLNKIPQQQYDGWQTFYKQGNEKGQKLATSIQNKLNEAIQKQNNRVPLKIDNIYIIKHVQIPTTIVECGFLSNPQEEQNLLQDQYQDKLAWGIYTGIINYFYEQQTGDAPKN